MKHFRIVLVVLALLFAVNAQAAEPKPYMGAKIGQMMPDGGGFDDATNIGVVLGMTLNQVQAGSISLEGELTFSVADGDIDLFGASGDWDIMTLAGYGVFRSNGPLYFKGKAGLLYEDVSVDAPGLLGGYSDDDIGLSIGVGGGYKLSDKASLELEYTIIESDVDFLSIGMNVNF